MDFILEADGLLDKKIPLKHLSLEISNLVEITDMPCLHVNMLTYENIDKASNILLSII